MNTGPSSSLSALRQLLQARFPAAARPAGGVLPTGIPAVDASCGGLPRCGLTELVCTAPSCGSQLFLGQLLQTTRTEALRVALVDRDDAFDPDSWPPRLLDHLVWIRAHDAIEALAAADLLARDANLGMVVLDLRTSSGGELRRIAASSWYRLQRALEPNLLCGLVLTPHALVPSAHLRLELDAPHDLATLRRPRPELGAALMPQLLRQRIVPVADVG